MNVKAVKAKKNETRMSVTWKENNFLVNFLLFLMILSSEKFRVF